MGLDFNDYNRISGFYDRLKQWQFGRQLELNESYFLKEISEKSILVVGCGSAGFLEYINADYKSLVLLDKSEKMIRHARQNAKKHHKKSNITFSQGDFMNFESQAEFDIISMPYFLDLLKNDAISEAISRAHVLLKNEGFLIISDFDQKLSRGIGDSFIIWLMYRFFRLTTGIQRMTTPEYELFMSKDQWRETDKHQWPKHALFSGLWKKCV